MLKDFLEVRGLGLLNIRTIFGETAVRPKMRLKLVAHLQRPLPGGRDPAERLPLADMSEDVLGVTVRRSEAPTSQLQSLMRTSYAHTCLPPQPNTLQPPPH